MGTAGGRVELGVGWVDVDVDVTVLAVGRAGQGRNDGGGGEYALACCGYLHTVSYALQQGEQGSKNKAIIVRPATLSESGLQVKVFGMQ